LPARVVIGADVGVCDVGTVDVELVVDDELVVDVGLVVDVELPVVPPQATSSDARSRLHKASRFQREM